MCCQQPFPYFNQLHSDHPRWDVIPHASKELNETTVAECQRNDDVWVAETQCAQVDQGEDECSQSEGRETERSRIGELPALLRLVETRLEITTKSCIIR